MDTQDFKYNFYDYDIGTINCVNVSQVKSDFRISDDEDEETVKEPKKFYTLTNFVDTFDIKPDINGENNDTLPSTDIPIAIIETQPCKDYDNLNNEDEFININISKPGSEKPYIIETYSNDLHLHSLEKRPPTPEYKITNPEPPVESSLMEVEIEVPLKCKDCDFTTFQDEDLKTHMKTHAPPSLFSCNVCGHFFKHSYSVKRHMRIHTRVAAYKCNECSFECQRSESLKAHKKIHSEDKIIVNNVTHKCNICSFSTVSKSLLKTHLDSHTKESQKSDDCDFSATRLLLGITSDSEERPCDFNNINESSKLENSLKCSECNYSTTKLVHLKMHMRKHSSDVPFKCKLCNYTTAKKGNFVVHLRNHTGEKPYRCASCGFTCKQFIHLKRHIKNHGNEEELFGCSKCEYRTGEGRELEMHIKTHGGPDQLTLDDLQYEDESSDAHSNSSDAFLVENVVENRKKVTKTKMHKCLYCEYTTNQTGNLKRHQKTHFKEDKQKDNCVSPSALDAIKIVTTPEKVFECTECNYKASRKHQMDIHMRVHNGKQLYECNLCDYKTVNKYNLSRHQKTHTFDESNVCQTIKEEIIIKSEVLT